jgi:endonuclease YncB( thermonuclease family)
MPRKKESAKKRKKGLLAILILLIVMVIFVDIAVYISMNYNIEFKSNPKTNSTYQSEYYRITGVIDGSTLKIDNGEIVKLIGIDSPNKGGQFYDESVMFMNLLALNKDARLERDTEDKDSEGNLERYVFVMYNGKEIMLNTESVKQGYSVSLLSEPNLKYESEINQARSDCLKSQVNLCGL